MPNSNLIAQQIQTCNNLHQGALAILNIKDEVEAGNFANASLMLSKLAEAIEFTHTATTGMELLQEMDEI